MGDFWPGWTTTTVLFCLFFIAQSANQRWVRARLAGMRGASEGIGLIVDLTGGIALVFGLLWPFAYGFDVGWRYAVGLYAVGFLIMLAYSVVTSALVAGIKRATLDQIALKHDRMGGDLLVLWVLGTLALWPLMVMLGARVSWFGWL
jgi:hypothetical protein